MKPVVSIIIVSYNVSHLLRACLRSLFGVGTPIPFDVIVVDSASTDDTVSMLQQEFPQVTLLAQAINVGFSRGNNIGMAAATGDYLFLLNPDTVMLSGCIDRLVNYLIENAQVGLCGPQTLNSDGTIQSTRRRFPTFWTGVFESTILQGIAPRRVLEHYYALDLPDTEDSLVDWVQGSALMVRRPVYEAIGGLDEAFFMYSEELDWCKRAAIGGWKCAYVGSAELIHHGGKSSEQAPASTHINFQQSKLRYVRRYRGHAEAQFLRVLLLANYAILIVIEQGKRLLGHKRDLRRERVQTYVQVLRSGLQVN